MFQSPAKIYFNMSCAIKTGLIIFSIITVMEIEQFCDYFISGIMSDILSVPYPSMFFWVSIIIGFKSAEKNFDLSRQLIKISSILIILFFSMYFVSYPIIKPVMVFRSKKEYIDVFQLLEFTRISLKNSGFVLIFLIFFWWKNLDYEKK